MQQAYLRLLAATADVAVLDATIELARENLKVNDSLYRNGKATRDLVYRAEADLLETEQRRLTAANAAEIGRAYVNVLRNRPLATDVPIADVRDIDEQELLRLPGNGNHQGALAELTERALSDRRELRELDAAKEAARAGEALARAGFRPTLGFNVEGGTQGETYGFSSSDRYVLASVVLRFNLFDGGGDRAAVRRAHAALSQIDAQRADTENRIRLEVQRGLQDYVAARASIDTARKRLEASRAAFAISQKKRDLGAINQAEFIDSRRALTDAALNLNQTRFQALSSLADLDYATGRAARTLRDRTGE
jgi:outer membrane protein